jgi:hypothetical protein
MCVDTGTGKSSVPKRARTFSLRYCAGRCRRKTWGLCERPTERERGGGGRPSRGVRPEAIIVRMPEGWPESGSFVGRDAVMREIEQWRGVLLGSR